MSGLTGCGAEKAALRQRLLRQRAALENRAERDKAVYDRILMNKLYQSAENIFIYISKPEETDTRALIKYSLKSGKRLFVPYCTADSTEMRFYRLHSPEQLRPGSFGVLQPDPVPGGAAAQSDMECALCIVPGLSFDRTGVRLGYGKGYYDRFLSRNNIYRMGVCYESFFFRDALPAQPHDIRMQAVVTDEKLREMETGKGRDYA